MPRFTVDFADESVDKVLKLLAKSEGVPKKAILERAVKLLGIISESDVHSGGHNKVSITERKTNRVIKDVYIP